MHAKWIGYLQAFHFLIHPKSGHLNEGAKALSRRYLLLCSLGLRVLGFEMIKELYPKDEDCKKIFESCSRHPNGKFHSESGFLFKGARLCIPKGGIRELLIIEVHKGALVGHVGNRKTCIMLKEHYYCPKMAKDVEHFVKRCFTCLLARAMSYLKVSTHPCNPSTPWKDVSLDFITNLPRT